MKQMSKAVEFLRQQQGQRFIAFVGPVNRTWYVDVEWMHIVMEIFRDTCDYTVVIDDVYGFDHAVIKAAKFMGVGISGPDEVFRLRPGGQRGVEMLDGVCMVVAFPPEPRPKSEHDGKTVKDKNQVVHDFREADPAIIGAAKTLGIPVVAIRRNGSTEWHDWRTDDT